MESVRANDGDIGRRVGVAGGGKRWRIPYLSRHLFVNLFSEMERVPEDILVRMLANSKLFHRSFTSAAINASPFPYPATRLLTFLQPCKTSNKQSAHGCAELCKFKDGSIVEAQSLILEAVLALHLQGCQDSI